MHSHCSSKTSSLVSDFWRVHIVENRPNQLTLCFLTLNDVDKFIKTPTGKSVIFGEYNNWNPWVFNGFYKSGRNLIPSSKLLVIYESADSFLAQSIIEISCEMLVGISTSEAQEDKVILLKLEWWRGIKQTVSHHSCSLRKIQIHDLEIFKPRSKDGHINDFEQKAN